MGIFSVFGKKDRQKISSDDEKTALRSKRDEDDARLAASNEIERSNNAQQSQRNIARSTSMKIDAIESEMTLDILKPAPSRNSQTKQTAPDSLSDAPITAQLFESTLPLMHMQSTDYLLDGSTGGPLLHVQVSTSETCAAIEEAAVLYANDQAALVEHMLQDAILEDKLGNATRNAWWMLFDLYQITGKQLQFDSLSIDYASKFETSPPAWAANLRADEKKTSSKQGAATPSVAFAGVLDNSISKQLERVQKLSEKNQLFRLEFSRVTEVDPVGCALLLEALKGLQKSERNMVLVGASELAQKIRGIIEVGRRDESEAPWLLLMEILQLLNLENEFEEASIDYCVTFEVSPPAFVAPKSNKITTAAVETALPITVLDRFVMPSVIQGSISPLIHSITEFAGMHQRVVLDCAGLTRVDFTSAGQLLNGLAPLATAGKSIEFQDVNHLVAALLHVMSIDSIAKIFPHKY